jgi:hypothetical protein
MRNVSMESVKPSFGSVSMDVNLTYNASHVVQIVIVSGNRIRKYLNVSVRMEISCCMADAVSFEI